MHVIAKKSSVDQQFLNCRNAAMPHSKITPSDCKHTERQLQHKIKKLSKLSYNYAFLRVPPVDSERITCINAPFQPTVKLLCVY